MQAWNTLCQEQERLLGKETANKWLNNLKILHFDACNLYLEAKDSFQALWFEEHIRPYIKKNFKNNNSKIIRVHLSISEAQKDRSTNAASKTTKSVVPTFQLSFDELNPEYTFEHFIPSKANQLPYRLLCELADFNPDEPLKKGEKFKLGMFNPIYLFGESGCGKTHLAMACAHRLRQAGLKVVYARAETFTSHVVRAIRLGHMKAFRKAYRELDVLILDNAQVLSRKNATQEELFHTFNTLHNNGKQIILLADCSPPELQSIEPRLVSRFEWGLSTSLKMLGKDEMKELIKLRAQESDFIFPQDVIDFLIEVFSSSTKSLVKAFEALHVRLFLNKKTKTTQASVITLELLKRTLRDLLDQEKQDTLTPEKIIQTVADFYGIKSEDILGKSQSRECASPRQVAMHLCRLKLKLPFMKLGNIFSRDHSTVMTSVKQIQKHLDSKDSETAQSINLIQKKLSKKT
ncbi:Chromosomal replication initiator protein DnaA 1 [Chlamydiales bacterium SCGC AB-751-O23]|jgi:chromosomal replication initiator protein|nr:Chromosomal replication initiator protein DnaA 1 [Chlamydiales bacterium SCGC AB-751-O23]